MQETMQSVKETTELRQWFVMRDLKRGNAKQPAYKLLGELKIRFFTPMGGKLRIRQGKRVRQQVPLINNMSYYITFQHQMKKYGMRLPHE